MRMRHALLLAIPLFALSAFAAGSTPASSLPPCAGYVWVQPWTAPVDTPYAQPPAWIQISAPVLNVAVPGSSYEWTQPGMPPVDTPCAQPPAWIPTG
jgi:hypothetical protein